jgi:NAD(P)-dependent dehydrogenase (short-subunit alcohol dehydrogenase family)
MRHKKNRTYSGAVAILTGGASGIGRALGEALAGRGCEVVLADLQIDLAEEVAGRICAAGGKAAAFKVDVTDFAAVAEVVKKTVERTGRLDYMFNNAGIGIGGEVRDFTLEDWNRVIDVNIRGVINGIQAVYQVMLNQGFGHIVNTASMAGLVPIPVLAAYTASKHAVVGLSKALRIEAVDSGVRVSVLCPGVIRTPILERGGKYGKILEDIPQEALTRIVDRMKPMPADIFARKALKKIAKNRAVIVVPGWWKIPWWFNRLSPSFGIFIGEKFFQRSKKEVERFKSDMQ